MCALCYYILVARERQELGGKKQMGETEMSKSELIATLVAIRENARQHNEVHTVELIDLMIKEMKSN